MQVANNKLSIQLRFLIGACALSLIAVLFLPIWQIQLTAPQYPEGLVLKIYANKLGGDVDIVNGLNHYIGMRALHAKDFVEFTVLPYIIVALIFFGSLSAVLGKRWFFFIWVGFYVLFAITALVDFYRWEYNYGHNLNPEAPIQVPGMAYQPPLIGFKQLLNFGAYAIPDSGGWIMFAVGLLLAVITIREIWMHTRIHKRALQFAPIIVLISSFFLLSSCNSGPQPIQYGKEDCHFCQMTLTDKRFGAELVTRKGKSYVFDDIHCLTSFLETSEITKVEIGDIYLVNYASPGELLKSHDCFLLQSDSLKAPMGGNIVAFGNLDQLNISKNHYGGKILKWDEIVKK